MISEEQIENLHATQLSDFQALVPGLYVSTNGAPGKTQVSLRGVAPLSSGATVGTYLDETPLGSSGIYQAANFFALDLLPYDIARIEVLRGPQGTLYGAGSMGGLIKYVTVAPDLSTTSSSASAAACPMSPIRATWAGTYASAPTSRWSPTASGCA